MSICVSARVFILFWKYRPIIMNSLLLLEQQKLKQFKISYSNVENI